MWFVVSYFHALILLAKYCTCNQSTCFASSAGFSNPACSLYSVSCVQKVVKYANRMRCLSRATTLARLPLYHLTPRKWKEGILHLLTRYKHNSIFFINCVDRQTAIEFCTYREHHLEDPLLYIPVRM